MKSIISNDRVCYICGSTNKQLHKHHFLHGSNHRQLAEEDGLYAELCYDCHNRVHNYDPRLDLELKKIAQAKWEEVNGTRKDFIKRYKRSYL